MKYNVQSFKNNYLKYTIQIQELGFDELDQFNNLIINMDPMVYWKYSETDNNEQWLVAYDWKITNTPGETFDSFTACTIHNRLEGQI